jgi:hypothetical protein
MSTLRNRIQTGLSNSNPDLSVVGRYATPLETPLMRIQIYPDLITYEDMEPLVSGSDGAPIAATGPGTWGQLYAAGRP